MDPKEKAEATGQGFQWTAEGIEKLVSELTPMLTTWAIRVIGALIGFLIAMWLAKRVRAVVEKALKKTKVDATLVPFLGSTAQWTLLTAATISILGVFGADTGSFAAVLGATGLAIGLAFQGSLSNVASGVMLLVFRPFQVGDVVQVGGITGKVNAIGLMTVNLDTPDNRRIILPNSKVFGSEIENVTFHDKRRCDVAIGTGYDDDLDKVREALLDVANATELKLDGEDVQVVLTNLGGSSIDWQIRVWCATSDFFAVKEDVTDRAKKRMDADGFSIPYPQMDVHVHNQAA